MIDVAGEVAAWFTDPANWEGTRGIPNRVLEHVILSFLAVVIAATLAIVAGLLIGHTNRGAFLAVSVANIGRALPSLALLILAVPFLGIRWPPSLFVLVLLAIPPILTNTYAGMRAVDRDTIEAGRGMGMSETALIRRVELPLALPVIIAGVRTAAVQVVATATLAAIIGAGGLGRFIVDGFAVRDEGQVIGGAILVALLALATERLLTLIERRTVSPGLRLAGYRAPELEGATTPTPTAAAGRP
jgi:osmoprotectant transport system permease protein